MVSEGKRGSRVGLLRDLGGPPREVERPLEGFLREQGGPLSELGGGWLQGS